MPFPVLQRRQWGLFICAAVVLLLPAGLAVAAPALAPLPAPSPARWQAPPLPDRETPLPGFQDLLDPLLLVVRDLPDQASRDLVAAYDRATLFDPQPARDMLAAAEGAILPPSALKAVWDEWVYKLKSASFALEPVPAALLETLRSDPRNGDRLSNLAVAFYFTGLTENHGYNDRRDMRNALSLLGMASQAFPENRALTLNYAFLSAFYIGYGATDPAESLDADAVLTAWSTAHADDVTALQLLVTTSLSGFEPAPETTVALLNRLAALPDAQRAALGHAWLGDLNLRSARLRQLNAPFMAAQLAREALREYDEALRSSDDPAIYSARAVALEFLGDLPAAIATQGRAVQLLPDSAPPRELLAEFYGEQRGDERQVLASMRLARETSREALTIAARQQNPLLRDVQLGLNPELTHGNRRDVEYSAFRPARAYLHLGLVGNVPGGSAGEIISYDLIPAVEREPKVATVSLPFERAAYTAIVASVILGDPQGAAEDAETLLRLLGDVHRLDGPADVATRLRAQVLPAAQLVADLSAPSDAAIGDVGFAVDALRHAGLPARAAELCRAALDRPDATNSREYLLTCLGENAYLAGDYDLARQAFAALGSPLYEGFIAQVTGDAAGAMRLYTTFLSAGRLGGGTSGVVTARLGEVMLDSGDSAGAIEQYDRAIALLGGGPDGPSAGESERATLQHARNNRGAARLKLLSSTGSAPDCSGTAVAECTAALADFDAALRSDPANPIYLLGKAWAERLLGKSDAAAESLNQAARIDPAMYPAFNDLGVLAARAGDLPRARRAFLSALAVNPGYDLALWNLGVLEMQRGVRGAPRGQAYLARAILQNPSFASSGLAYRMDEGIYRIEFNERVKAGAGWSFASATSVATAGFGLVAAVAIILQAMRYFKDSKLQDAFSIWTASAAKWAVRKSGRTLSLPSGDGWSRWLPWLITLPALAFVTSWSALRENPDTAAASAFLALFAALAAVVVHEAGHALVAWKLNARVRPAQWGPGTALALALLPVHLNAGPFPGQRVDGDDEGAAWRVLLAGPLANLLAALGAYLLFYFQPLPGLRSIALVQCAAMSYALLPFEPLDGAVLARSRPAVTGGLAFLGSIAGLLFYLGLL